ncbi:MAG: LysR family transcriptional regulator [Marvinbryantia sp.]|jgi:DNA-binding transcriptional LysR family regulator
MIDRKQMQYFTVCAQSGSFSEAARSLYTTQSNVSRAIKNLEDSMGIILFERLPRGIRLTAQGTQVYRQVCKIQKEMDVLETLAKTGQMGWMRISCNPSSWLASQFVEFYNENYEKNYHCQVHTDSVRRILERVRDYKDEIGFVYVAQHQMENFLQEVTHGALEFIPLQQVQAMIYLGGAYEGDITGEHPLRFIQNYEDEFADPAVEKVENEHLFADMDVAVVTNSDYIMERMLNDSPLVNISGRYLTEKKETSGAEGIPLPGQEEGVTFGYLKRRGETPEGAAGEFVEFVKEKLKKQPQNT